MSQKNKDASVKHRHALLAMHRRDGPQHTFPSLPSNLGNLDALVDYDEPIYDSSLLFGPGGAMFLPANPAAPQSQAPPQTTTASLAASPSPSSASSTMANSHAPLSSASPSSSASASSTAAPSSARPTPTSSPSPTSTQSPQSSKPLSTASQPQSQSQAHSQSQIQILSQSQSQSQTSNALIASTTSSATMSQSSVTSAATASGSSSLSTSLASVTASTAASSSSSIATSNSPTNSENLPHLAAIVIGVVAAFSAIAFLATLGSWFYKQRVRKHDHTEITSINSSSFDDHPRGFFGCMKKRRGKHTDDMSELGFGLGHVNFFGEGNSGDEHHRAGLALCPEGVLRDDEYSDEKPFQLPHDPFASHSGGGFTDSAYPSMRPLPAHIHGPVDGASSLSLSPYAHLAPARALGGSSATPLTVANLVPGDESGDESNRGGYLAPPRPVMRRGSLGTPRLEASAPRFMSLAEGDGLTVPWAPLNVRGSPGPQDMEGGVGSREGTQDSREQDDGFQPLALSRTSTLSMAFSRSFSQRLGHSLSRAADWHDGVTRPPPGTFRATWDASGSEHENDVTGTNEPNTWATTLRNNIYSAFSAVGSSVRRDSSTGATSTLPGPGHSAASLPNPYAQSAMSSRRSSMRFPFGAGSVEKEHPSGDILTPPPARVAGQYRRTKGSIIRGNLGMSTIGEIDNGMGERRRTGLGIGIDALSRSSTLSTSWSDAEKGSSLREYEKVRVRGLDSATLARADTGNSTASSIQPKANPGRRRLGARNLKAPSRRPRYSRMHLSQSSVWSSESYASASGEEGRR